MPGAYPSAAQPTRSRGRVGARLLPSGRVEDLSGEARHPSAIAANKTFAAFAAIYGGHPPLLRMGRIGAPLPLASACLGLADLVPTRRCHPANTRRIRGERAPARRLFRPPAIDSRRVLILRFVHLMFDAA